MLALKVCTVKPGPCNEFCWVVAAVFCVEYHVCCFKAKYKQKQSEMTSRKGNSWICAGEAKSPDQAGFASLLFLALATLPLETGLLPLLPRDAFMLTF